MKLEQSLLAFVQRRYLAIVVMVVLAAGVGVLVAGFKVENAIESWVDQGDIKYQRYQAMIDAFGDDASLHVVFDRADLTASLLPEYEALLDRIRAQPLVTQLFDPVDPYLLDLKDRSLEKDVDGLRRSRRQEPPGPLDVLIAPDLDTIGVLILLDQEHPDDHSQVVNLVREGFAELGLPIQLAGTAYVSQTIAEALTRDITLVVIGLQTVAMLVLLVALRNVWVVGSIYLALVFSVVFCLAFATLLQVKLNLLSLVLFPLVFCVGLTTAIHLFTRTRDGEWHFDYAWGRVLRPATLAMLTTLVGASAFAFAPQRVVRDMGLVIPFGVVITFLMMLIFAPAAFRLANRGWSYTPPRLNARGWLPATFSGPLSIGLILLALGSAILIPRIDAEPDAIFFFPQDSELVTAYRSIEQKLTGLLVTEMVVESIDGQAVTSATHLESLQAFIDQTSGLPGLSTIVSPVSILRETPELWDINPDLQSAFVSEDGQRMRLSYRFRNISDIPYAESAAQLQQAWDTADMHGLRMELTGLVPLILEAQAQLLRTQGVIFPVVLLIITLILFLIMRSWRLLLLALIANFLPLLLVLGTMAVLAIPLNSINLFVASIMLGVIVDDTIHLLHAWHESGDMQQALAEVRPALWLTSVTMVLAFSSLFVSGLAPIQQFGLLSLVAIVTAYLCDAVLLPWLSRARPAA